MRHLRAGYDRLVGYQASSGGFSYFGSDEPDRALTAYAIEFLTSAARYIDVDRGVAERAAKWLVRNQDAYGSWAGQDARLASTIAAGWPKLRDPMTIRCVADLSGSKRRSLAAMRTCLHLSFARTSL
jgi:hypothetical protein